MCALRARGSSSSSCRRCRTKVVLAALRTTATNAGTAAVGIINVFSSTAHAVPKSSSRLLVEDAT